MIKRIELINFMSHEHTVIKPSEGLTVLIGPNNCGKSAVVSALQVLCSNPTSTYVLRHGAKEVKIIVETDGGDRIIWSRKKSGSPKYEINGKSFDRLNRKVPEELHKILRLPAVQADKETYDVHFGEQRSPIFLLGDKEKAAAQFFASSSDAIHLVEMQTLHKNRVRRSKHEAERLKEERELLEKEIEFLTPVEEIKDAANDCQKQYQQLQKRFAKTEQLRSEIKQLGASWALSVVLAARNKVLSKVPGPPSISPTAGIKTHLLQLEILQRKKSHIEKSGEVLDALCNPPTIDNTFPLSRSIDQLHSCGQHSVRLQKNLSTLNELKPLPALKKVDRLIATIARLTSASFQQEALGKKSERLAKLDEPPQLDSPQQLQNVIEALGGALKNQEQLNQLLATISKELVVAKDACVAWIGDHPQCPTCGSELSQHNLDCGSTVAQEANDDR